MTISIAHETIFLKHESGTKFYEVVLLHAPDIGVHLVIKRWGKTGSAVSGGGEIQLNSFTNARKAQAAASTIINQKEGRGYAKRSVAIGLHGYGGNMDGDNAEELLESHYGTANAGRILSEFGGELGATKITGKKADFMIIDELGDIVSEEPAPEPERGDSWGSW
jgi:predicted DNA-binding WGR domain protein